MFRTYTVWEVWWQPNRACWVDSIATLIATQKLRVCQSWTSTIVPNQQRQLYMSHHTHAAVSLHMLCSCITAHAMQLYHCTCYAAVSMHMLYSCITAHCTCYAAVSMYMLYSCITAHAMQLYQCTCYAAVSLHMLCSCITAHAIQLYHCTCYAAVSMYMLYSCITAHAMQLYQCTCYTAVSLHMLYSTEWYLHVFMFYFRDTHIASNCFSLLQHPVKQQ